MGFRVPVFLDSLSSLKPKSPATIVIALAGVIALLYFGQLFFVTLITIAGAVDVYSVRRQFDSALRHQI